MRCKQVYKYTEATHANRTRGHNHAFKDLDGNYIRTRPHITPHVIDHCHYCNNKINIGDNVFHRKNRRYKPIYHEACARRLNII